MIMLIVLIMSILLVMLLEAGCMEQHAWKPTCQDCECGGKRGNTFYADWGSVIAVTNTADGPLPRFDELIANSYLERDEAGRQVALYHT